MRRGLMLVLCGLALLAIGARAAYATTFVLHHQEIIPVAAGVDQGEPDMIPGISMHPVPNDRFALNFHSITFQWERYADANQVPISLNGQNYDNRQVVSASVTSGRVSNVFCSLPNDSAIYCDRPNAGASYPTSAYLLSNGTFSFEQALATYAAPPGYYRLHIQSDAPEEIIERHYGVAIAHFTDVNFHFKDQYGVNIQGASMHILAPAEYGPSLPSNAQGFSAISHMQTGHYQAVATAPGCQQWADYLDTGDPAQGQSSVTVQITMNRTSGTDPNSNIGGVKLTVKDKTTGAVIAGAAVTSDGAAVGSTDANGILNFQGSAGDHQVGVTKTGYTGGLVKVTIEKAQTKSITIKLSTDGTPPDVSTDPDPNSGDFWQELFKKLFVPSDDKMRAFFAEIQQIQAWGPFAIAHDFDQAWHANNLDGPENLLMPFTVALWGTNGPAYTGYVDFREGRTQQQGPYEDGTYGTIWGTCRKHLRTMFGWCSWALFGLGLIRVMQPRMQA